MLRHFSLPALLAALLWSITIAGFAPDASSKPQPKPAEKTKPAPSKADIDAMKKRLEGTENDAIAALQAIAESESPEMAPLVSDVLGRGGSEKVIAEALTTASKLKVESLSANVAPYVSHRSEDIRRQACRTLLKTKGPIAVASLKQALRSPDAVVRGTAATGLGALGARDSLPDLFLAFDHGVSEAGGAIGQLCKPEECEKFAERTGRVPFDIMSSGFDQILFRPPTEIPDEAKLLLIGRMREIGTAEVAKYLADVSDRWPKEWSKKLKQVIDSAVRASGAGGKK
jgi:hypothetical protein